MPRLFFETLLLASTVMLIACNPERGSQQRVWEDNTGRVTLVELAPEIQSALEAAPTTILSGTVPNELREAIESNSIESVKVQLVQDKVDGKITDEFPPTYQGWIYYEPTRLADGVPFAPAVLCVSQSDPIVWSHCQDASDLATKRLLKKQRQQT